MKIFPILITIISLFMCRTGHTQMFPYNTSLFAYDSLMNISYGTATDYAGQEVELLVDIYKPMGDDNCLRPVMVLVHGGAWIAGSKSDPTIVAMARYLATRGWVTACINYRLGTHKTSNYTMYAFCNDMISAPCGYISDSAEVYRANFRAMQDAKGAIRYMKSRHQIDSTDIHNVFIAGESAGGFIALAAAYTDQENEKHISCYAIDDAPLPDPDLMAYGCIPSQNNRTRPDLGSIDGTLHTGQYDATVEGVASFYGGVLDLNIFEQVDESPSVYLYHQGSDVVVHYRQGALLNRLSWECFAQTNLCQSYHHYPHAYGGKGIVDYLVSLIPDYPRFTSDIIDNYLYLGNCFSNGHSIDQFSLQMSGMTWFFSELIYTSGNSPSTNCTVNSIEAEDHSILVQVYPNPASQIVYARVHPDLLGATYEVYAPSGRRVASGTVDDEQLSLSLSHVSAGLYYLRIGEMAGMGFILLP